MPFLLRNLSPQVIQTNVKRNGKIGPISISPKQPEIIEDMTYDAEALVAKGLLSVSMLEQKFTAPAVEQPVAAPVEPVKKDPKPSSASKKSSPKAADQSKPE